MLSVAILLASAIRWIFLIRKLEKNCMLVTLFTAVFPFNFWSEHVTHKPGDQLAVEAPCQCPGMRSRDLQWMQSMSEDHVLVEGKHKTHKMSGSYGDSGSPQRVSRSTVSLWLTATSGWSSSCFWGHLPSPCSLCVVHRHMQLPGWRQQADSKLLGQAEERDGQIPAGTNTD